MKKKIFLPFTLGLMLGLVSQPTLAEAPDMINYQGYLTDSSGNPIDDTVSVIFSLHDTAEGTENPRWESQPYSALVVQGLINQDFGPVNRQVLEPLPVYLGISVNDEELKPRLALTSVPFVINDQDMLASLNCANSQVAKQNGGAWICADDEGITSESDPTVPANLKDGVSWSEVSNRPVGLDDGDDVGITVETDPKVGLLTPGKWCTSNGTQVNCTSDTPSGGDNLGNHTATQNIKLNGNWLSDDGGSEGISIDGSNVSTSADLSVGDELTVVRNATFGSTSTSSYVDIYGGSLEMHTSTGTNYFELESNNNNETVINNPTGGDIRLTRDLVLRYSDTSTWRNLYAGKVQIYDEELEFRDQTSGNTVAKLWGYPGTLKIIAANDGNIQFQGGEVEMYTDLDVSGDARITGELQAGGTTSADVGVFGATSSGYGVRGYSDISSGIGVAGKNGSSGYEGHLGTNNKGVYGYAPSSSGKGVVGKNTSGYEGHLGTDGGGVYGYAPWSNVQSYAIGAYFEKGPNNENSPIAILAGREVGGKLVGVKGDFLGEGIAVMGVNHDFNNGWAGYFDGNVKITGTTSYSASVSRIDHPLDPENKYLDHSSVGSPDMKTLYDGVVRLDENGEAMVALPEWFEALNKDFRYQLTPIGAPAPDLYIAQEIKDNQFKIAGGQPEQKVSWQVTGIRNDPFARTNPMRVEEAKSADERGKYLHPKAYGLPEARGINQYHQEISPTMELDAVDNIEESSD